jgi:hypothetical protein
MLEQQIDLWDVKDGTICITTNGTITKDGRAVMGRGCALEAAKKYPAFPKLFADILKTAGNHVILFQLFIDRDIITFPVKHNWYEKADIELIKKSCLELVDLMQKNSLSKVYLPRPGCGNGHLDWDKDVKPVIKDLLPDNVIIVSK